MLRNAPHTPQRGFILVASLVILLIMSIVGVSMYRGAALQEKISGNLKDKTRALQAAQATLRHAEALLAQSNTNPLALANSCNAALTAPTVCGNGVSIQNAPTAALTNGYTDTAPPGITAADISTTGGDGTYYAYPQFYIQYLGLTSTGQGQIYKITALAYGGSAAAVSIVQSTYELTSGITNLGTL